MTEETANVLVIVFAAFSVLNVLVCGLTFAACLKMYTEFFKERVKKNDAKPN